MTQRLYIMRGLPGCGKSTHARGLVEASDRESFHASRDAIRAELGFPAHGSTEQEKQVNAIQGAKIRQALSSGFDVYVDNQNLRRRDIKQFVELAIEYEAEPSLIDMTDVPLDTVLAQNAARTEKTPVPEGYIREQFQRFVKNGAAVNFDSLVAETKAEKEAEDMVTKTLIARLLDANLPGVVLCDIDGTVAYHDETIRGHHEYHKVNLDTPRQSIIDLVEFLYRGGKHVVFFSGRKESCRDLTEEWIAKYIPALSVIELYMRDTDDNRSDAITKREMLENYIAGRYCVEFVLDDRDRVVKMMRDLGLTVLQVNYGAF